jgi:hypothetical protein
MTFGWNIPQPLTLNSTGLNTLNSIMFMSTFRPFHGRAAEISPPHEAEGSGECGCREKVDDSILLDAARASGIWRSFRIESSPQVALIVHHGG